MEDNGYKYIHKLTQFVTTLKSRRSCSIDLMPKNVKNSDFLSILYSKPLRENWKSNFKVGDRVGIWKFDWYFRNGHKPQFTQGVFAFFANSSWKPPTTQKMMNRTILSAVNFISKNWSKSYKNGIVHSRLGFRCICSTIRRQHTQPFLKLLTAATESGRSTGGWVIGTILPTSVPKCHRGKICVFD